MQTDGTELRVWNKVNIFMANQVLRRVPWSFKGERTVSSTNDTAKTG
jgi:hypothetical protein